MGRYVLCYDGTRIYFQKGEYFIKANCEACGDLGTAETSAMWSKVNTHTSRHGGKHSVN